MESDGNAFQLPKFVLLSGAIAAVFFGMVAVTASVIAFAWQGLVNYTPNCFYTMRQNTYCVDRREGLFQMCATSDLSLAMCDTYHFGRFTSASQQNYGVDQKHILDLRVAVLVCFTIALVLVVLATFLGANYLCFWHRSGYDTELMLLYRLLIISIFIMSGIVYQSAMFLLHFYYYQEKVFGSGVIPFNQARWPVVALVDTQIQYGASYFLFWTSMGLTYLAAFLFYFATVYSSNYYTECDVEELKPLDYKEQPSFPRLTTHDSVKVKSIYPNLSPPGTSNTAGIRSVTNRSR